MLAAFLSTPAHRRIVMAALPASVEEWHALLSSLLDPATAVQATKHLEVALDETGSMQQLLCVFCKTNDAWMKQLCAVLLRLRITRHWDALTDQVKQEFKDTLTGVITQSPPFPPNVIFSVADLLAKIGECTLCGEENEWPQLLPWIGGVFEASLEKQETVIMVALLRLLNSLCTETDALLDEYAHLHKMYFAAVTSPNMEIALEAIKGLSSLCFCVVEEEQAQQFSDFIGPLMKIVMAAMQEGAEDPVNDSMRTLEEVMQHELFLVGPHLTELVRFALTVSNNKENPRSLRQRVLGFVEVAATYRPVQLLQTNLLGGILLVLFTMAMEPDEEEHNNDDEGDADSELTNFKFGVQFIDILATGLPSKFTFQNIMAFVNKYKGSENPFERRTAISVLGTIAEGCYKELYPLLETELLPLLQENLRHPDIRVRTAGCMAILEFSKHLHPQFQEYHAVIMELLFGILGSEDERERKRGLLVLENFIVKMESEDLEGYLANLITNLLQMLGRSGVEEQCSIITCLSGVVTASDQNITPHFEKIMALMTQLMEQDQHLLLRARGMECVGILAVTAGKELFAPHANNAGRLALQGIDLAVRVSDASKNEIPHKESEMVAHSSELKELTWAFFQNMASCMKEDFAVYLDQLMPLLLQTAVSKEGYKLKKEEGVPSGLSVDEENVSGVCVRESFMEEKAAAVDAIGGIAQHTGAAFVKFLKPAHSALSSLMTNFSERLRKSVFSALKELVLCAFLSSSPAAVPGALPGRLWAAENGPALSSEFAEFLGMVLPFLINNLARDPSCDVVEVSLEAMTDLLKVIGPTLLDEDNYAALAGSLMMLMDKNAQCQAKIKDLGADDDRFESVRVFDSVVDCIGEVALAKGQSDLNFLRESATRMREYAKPQMVPGFRLIAVGCIGELAKRVPNCVTPDEELIKVVVDCVGFEGKSLEEGEVRRNAIYTLGILCEIYYGPYASSVAPAVQLFGQVAKQDATDGIQDNIAGAMARFLNLALNGVVPDCDAWLNFGVELMFDNLPLKEDKEPSTSILQALFTIFEKKSSLLNNFLPQTLLALCDALHENSVLIEEATPRNPPVWHLEEKSVQQATYLMREIAKINAGAVQQAMANASEEQQQVCSQVLA